MNIRFQQHLTRRSRTGLVTFSLLAAGLAGALGCGAKSGLTVGDRPDAAPPEDAGPPDADAVPDAQPDVDVIPDGWPDADEDVEVDADEDTGCVPVDDECRRREICDNGSDDDCDGEVDEDCFCDPGAVQACFLGPAGRRDVGSCADGAQVCEMPGQWGPCEGGIWPREDVCNGLDNLCNGCSERYDCEIDCPGPDDPRVPEGTPLTEYALHGGDFYPGLVESWRWSIEGGPCDEIAPRFESFELRGAGSEDAVFFPRLSGDYTVRLAVTTAAGTRLGCEWIVHVAGPGLRIEMCYPESEYQDLDLFVKQPGQRTPWYYDRGDVWSPFEDTCGWHNCEAHIRGTTPSGRPYERADWGYEPSDVSECEGGPLGVEWAALGFCANPRLDIDNNLAEGTGLPENINIDAPREGETFRIMIENFTGGLTRPLVNVYCGGRRVATYGRPPDVVPDFEGVSGERAVGAMWRVADVTTHVDPTGRTSCEVTQLHPPGAPAGYHVTYGDVSY